MVVERRCDLKMTSEGRGKKGRRVMVSCKCEAEEKVEEVVIRVIKV